MTIYKFKKPVNIHKRYGNVRLDTTCYCSFESGKKREWTELHLWYDNDCEHCPCGWEDRSYEGECNDCGCFASRAGGDFAAPTLVCMMPNWVKNLIVNIRLRGYDR